MCQRKVPISGKTNIKNKFKELEKKLVEPIFEYKGRVETKETFRNLLDKTFIKKTDGQYSFTEKASKVIQQIDQAFISAFKEFKGKECKFPSTIKNEDLKLLGFLDNYANVICYQDEDRREKAFLPAACLPCYIKFKNRKLSKDLHVVMTQNTIYRHEKGYPHPFVLNCFDMREFIFLGEKKSVCEAIERSMEKVKQLARGLNFTFSLNRSADLFYGESSQSKTLFQLFNQSKIELRVFSGELKEYFPIASINFHGTHFSRKFKIFRKSQYAYTACVAFGLQRWGLIILSLYGPDQQYWPKRIFNTLNPECKRK